MDKRIIWILIIALAITCLSYLCPFLIFSYTHKWKYNADFEEYGDDFKAVANHISALYPDGYDKYLELFYKGPDGTYRKALYDPDTNEYLELPADVQASLDAISSYGFPDQDGYLDVIWIHGDRISFHVATGQYALVFSPNEKPSWIFSPDEDTSVSVRKIEDGWYHVRKK